MIVDRATYRDGRRTGEQLEPAHTGGAQRAGDLAWVVLSRPTEGEFAALAKELGLQVPPIEHSMHAHQRPKLERLEDTLLCVLLPARYVEKTETVEIDEVHLFAGPRSIVTVLHGEAPDIAAVRQALESRPELLRRGPVAILHAIMDRVVHDYTQVVAALEDDLDQIEDEVFEGSSPGTSRRVYELSREVIAFHRATKPLPPMIARLIDDPAIAEEERRGLRYTQDRAHRVVEQADGFRQLLQNIMSVNLTLETKGLAEMSNALTEMSIAQNEDVKTISAWAAILFAPTLVGTIYGMNFEHMPELMWELGYPLALALMILLGVGLYVMFKRRNWI